MLTLRSLSPFLLLLLSTTLISSQAYQEELPEINLSQHSNIAFHPSEPVGAPEFIDSIVSDKELPVKEEATIQNSQETKPTEPHEAKDTAIPAKDEAKEAGTTEKGTIGGSDGMKKMFSTMCFVAAVLFVSLMCYYRIQMERTKVAPFAVPKYCPEFIFPKSSSDKRKQSIREAYQMIDVSEYNPPELNP